MTTRRQFLTHTALGFGSYLLLTEACSSHDAPRAAPAPAQPPTPLAPLPPLPKTGLQALTPETYATLAAACERILPRDADPGATDLGCAAYIDRVLAEPDARRLFGQALLQGLPVLDRQSQARYKAPFAAAAPEQQDELLARWQDSQKSGEHAFFEVLHALTLEGAFSDPSLGGNTGGQGFLLVGFVPPPPTPGVFASPVPGLTPLGK